MDGRVSEIFMKYKLGPKLETLFPSLLISNTGSENIESVCFVIAGGFKFKKS